jgi:hypothetical protein
MVTPTRFPRLRGEGQPSRAQDNIAGTLDPVARALAATPIMGAPAPTWIQPSLLGDLTNLGGGNATAGYHKNALGYVWMKGVITSAAGLAGGTQLLQLDMGYRPSETILFPVWSDAGAGQAISVDPSGIVFCQAAVGVAGWLTLNVSFLAEQ